ncbi:hypothetical protein E2C01_082864 [Portunus trituberculatus]|uniref:Uncharacterized protein n=1 Tax=Portunus trituberculatus TaxID=210409 RepID=A0A5B7J1Y6_PORTR|nr:hypothetical protein [Portunus trituberculatus]
MSAFTTVGSEFVFIIASHLVRGGEITYTRNGKHFVSNAATRYCGWPTRHRVPTT